MSEIRREVGDDGTLGLEYTLQLEKLVNAVLDSDKEAMFFLGAGASLSRTDDSLPSGRALAKELATECRLAWPEDVPLSTVAFYYEAIFGREMLNQFLRLRIAKPAIPPSSTLQSLIQIVQKLEDNGMNILVVTTNYDTKFEEEYEKVLHRKPHVIVFRGATDPNELTANLHEGVGRYLQRPQDWQPDRKHRTHIYKMHGCISEARDGEHNLVITEEDYINFLTNSLIHDEKKQILRYVRGRIALSTVLFVGYSLSDWNFRVIYKATAEANRDQEAFAIQHHQAKVTDIKLRQIDDLKWKNQIEFWGQKKVRVINVEASEFMRDFHNAISARLNKTGSRDTNS